MDVVNPKKIGFGIWVAIKINQFVSPQKNTKNLFDVQPPFSFCHKGNLRTIKQNPETENLITTQVVVIELYD